MAVSIKVSAERWRPRAPGVLLMLAGVFAAPPSMEAQEVPGLVFTPVPRCVVLDTRATGQPLVTNLPRMFDVAGTLANQGAAADCGIPFGPTVATAIRLQPVDPAANGTLRIWPYGGTVPSDGVVDFGPAIATSATADLLVPVCNPGSASCTRDLVVRADYSGTHLVVEVAGYFTPESAYQAGLGLTQDGNTFSVDTSTIQARVTGSCPEGASIRAIDAVGAVTCEWDDHRFYTAGPGLRLSGTQFEVDTNQIQAKVTGTCPSGIDRVLTDGSVVCAPRIQSGRRSGATACPTETSFAFPERFVATPVVIVTPNGFTGLTAPPNTYCVVDSVTTSQFQFCCYGHIPTYVNWMATEVR
jgi:hypothetical protein